MFGRGTARGWQVRERERERWGKVEGVLRPGHKIEFRGVTRVNFRTQAMNCIAVATNGIQGKFGVGGEGAGPRDENVQGEGQGRVSRLRGEDGRSTERGRSWNREEGRGVGSWDKLGRGVHRRKSHNWGGRSTREVELRDEGRRSMKSR